MIKVESNERHVKVEMKGDFIEILSETCAMLHSIYEGVPEHLREEFAREIHDSTALGGLCWMTREQRREQAAKMLRELLDRVEGKDKEGVGLGMQFEGEPVKADGDCSLEEMTRNAARMAMEKKEAESGEGSAGERRQPLEHGVAENVRLFQTGASGRYDRSGVHRLSTQKAKDH